LVLLACIALLLVIRGCLPKHQEVQAPPPPPREVFDKSKPFILSIVDTPESGSATSAWLARELNTLGSLAGLHIATAQPDEAARLFQLQILYSGRTAQLKLVAPDQIVERQQSISFADPSRLQIAKELTKQLLTFVGTRSNASVDAGLDFDAPSFQALTEAMDEIMGADSRGFTEVGEKLSHAASVSKLERVAKQNARNPRALSALALGYLSVGGPDHQSLLDLAEQRAQEALSIDQDIADAHAALGLAALRRNQWVSARESFDRALTLNPSSLPTLEGLACVFADVGQLHQAAEFAQRALALHPQNVGAQDCLNYARPSATKFESLTEAQKTNAALVAATIALLNKDYAHARELLAAGLREPAMKSWGESLLDAAQHPAHISRALQNITEAAMDRRIESSQVLLAGLALRKSDFVYNRLARLRAEHEPDPTRILWLAPAGFLRTQARFERVVTEADLPAYWHEYGRPDVCKAEPTVYGCGELTKAKSH
jgi:Tfp pilus assembly protein PilF